MKKLPFYSMLALSLCGFKALSAPYFQITKTNTVLFPDEILNGTKGLGDYLLTNVSDKDRMVYVRNIPAGFSLLNADDSGLTPCGNSSTFTLANGAACVLRLQYAATSITTFNQRIPMVCPSANYDIGCANPAKLTVFNVVNVPSPKMPTLSVANDVVIFAPGETTTITVTNNGSIAANNVSLELPTYLKQYLRNDENLKLTCDELAAGASCDFTVAMLDTLPSTYTELTATIQGSNTHPLILAAHVDKSLLSTNPITFVEPGQQKIILTNHDNVAMTDLELDKSNLPSGVSLDENAVDTCASNLAAGASCSYTFTATQDAYGIGEVSISAERSGRPSISETPEVTVTNTTASLNDGRTIVGDTLGSFTITNIGNFTWHSLQVERASDDSSWLTLSENTAKPCTADLVPNASCTVDYTIHGAHDYSSIITVHGTNVNNASQNFEPSEYVSLGIDGDNQYRHLAYKALKLSNLTNDTVALSNITAAPPSQLEGKIILCNATGSNCMSQFASTCLETNKTISEGGSCHIWYKAESTDNLQALTLHQINIGITATSSGGFANPIERAVNFGYSNELYAGGAFRQMSGITGARYLASWDGSSWHAFNSNVNAALDSLAFNGQDLYVGGSYFTSAGGLLANHIAVWNGSQWSALGDGASDAVYSLASIGNTLYAGGDFASMGGVDNTSGIAAWDGSKWSALGTGTNRRVWALASIGNTLYAGGDFASMGGVDNTWSIAAWDGSKWSALGTGTSNRVTALASINDTLYAGGDFASMGGVDNTNYIAAWNGSVWSALGMGANGNVRALASINYTLYAGGDFTSMGGVDNTNYIAAWDGRVWSALGTGADLWVRALASIGNTLYAGGVFTSMGGVDNTRRIAAWDGSVWSPLGTGADSNVLALVTAPAIYLS
jgi:hypothetical protein